MNDPERALLADGPQHGKRDQMVAAGRHRAHALLEHRIIERGDALHAVGKIDGIDANIAQVSAVGQLEGVCARHRMHLADHGGKIAQLARPVSWTRPVRRSGVPRHTDDSYVDLVDSLRLRLDRGKTHEGWKSRESWHLQPGDGKEGLIVGHWWIPFGVCFVVCVSWSVWPGREPGSASRQAPLKFARRVRLQPAYAYLPPAAARDCLYTQIHVISKMQRMTMPAPAIAAPAPPLRTGRQTTMLSCGVRASPPTRPTSGDREDDSQNECRRAYRLHA